MVQVYAIGTLEGRRAWSVERGAWSEERGAKSVERREEKRSAQEAKTCSARINDPLLGRANHERELAADVVITFKVTSVDLRREVAGVKGEVEPNRCFSVGIRYLGDELLF